MEKNCLKSRSMPYMMIDKVEKSRVSYTGFSQYESFLVYYLMFGLQ